MNGRVFKFHGVMVGCVLSCFLLGDAFAQELSLDDIRYRTPYRIAKPVIIDAFQVDSSLEQRRKALVQAAQKGYGSRADRILGNAVDILARTPGGMKTARGLASDSAAQRKGAARLVRMVDAFGSDSRYRVVDVEQNVYNRRGRLITDRDLVFRHYGSGSLGRIEVKDAVPSSQYSNLEKYKRQIRQLAAEQRATGQPQAFVNRRPLIPALQKYSAELGVPAYGNVVTSASGVSKQGQIHVTQVLNDIDDVANRQFRMKAASGGFGLLVSAFEGRHAYQSWNDYFAESGSATFASSSYHTAMASSGASLAVGGISSMLATQINASSRTAILLGQVGRYSGPFSVVLMGGAVGIQGYQYYSGEINTRQFVHSTSTSGGAFAGAIAGVWGGGALGVYGGPYAFFTVPAGALIGGIAGALSGQTIATYGVESYYSMLDTEHQNQLLSSLKESYEVRSRAK